MTPNASPLQTQEPRLPSQIRTRTSPSKTFPWQKPSFSTSYFSTSYRTWYASVGRGLTPFPSDEVGMCRTTGLPECHVEPDYSSVVDGCQHVCHHPAISVPS